MVRATSIETYHQIKNEGLLSKMRFTVYDLIHKHQPVSLLHLVKLTGANLNSSRQYSPRTSELLQMGLVYEHHTGACPVSGRNVIHWSTTDNLPTKLVVPPTRKEKKKLTRDAINETYRYINKKHGKDIELIAMFKEVVRNLESI